MKLAGPVASPPSKPLAVYDGDCTFCLFWVRRWQALAGGYADFLASQSAEAQARFPELQESFATAFHLIDVDGTVYVGAEAAFRALAANPDEHWLLDWYLHSPAFARASDRIYQFIAMRRRFFGRLTRIGWGRHIDPPRHQLSSWVFLRVLALIYLLAFASLYPQITALVGEKGVQPAVQSLEMTRQAAAMHNVGIDRYHLVPTLCWISASDWFLKLLCAGGIVLAGCLLFGIAPALSLFLLWLIYLSLATVCRDFMGYQWDNLLLETGFLAIFLAPLTLLPKGPYRAAPSRIVVWLFRFLLFRLMFESGLVKWVGADLSWRHLTALHFYFETQPLPTWVGWHAHQAPLWAHKAMAVTVLVIELVVPFFVFAPRRIRFVAFGAFVGLQGAIFLTGNFGFFNLLTIALCLVLLDDAGLRGFLPRRVVGLWAVTGLVGRRWGRPVTVPVMCVTIVITLMQFSGIFGLRVPWPRPLARAYEWIMPFRSFNSYGLFGVMTLVRPEIAVEGSQDGVTWREYEFKYKPGNLKRRPGFVAPHQPRLDWQMWFAALGNYEQNPWLVGTGLRLLQGSKEVSSLLRANPFRDKPPKYVRGVLYRYHFTDPATRRKTGAWWKREPVGLYLPMFSLEGVVRMQPPPAPVAPTPVPRPAPAAKAPAPGRKKK